MCWTRGQRGGGTTAPKGGGLGKQQGETTVGALGGVGQGRSYSSGGELGVPKRGSGVFGARGKQEIQVGAVRGELDPDLGGFPHTAGALHLQETRWFPKVVYHWNWKNGNLGSWMQVNIQVWVGFPTLLELWIFPCTCRRPTGFQRQFHWNWKNGNLMELGTNSDPVGYFKGISATHTILGNAPWGSSTEIQAQAADQSLVWSTRGGSATSPALRELWWLPVDPLLPPDPLQFQPQTLSSSQISAQVGDKCHIPALLGFREATEASGPEDLPHRITSRPLEVCPAPLEAAGKTPWSNFSCFSQSPALWKELCSFSAASTCPPPLGNIPCCSCSVPVAETAAPKGADPQIPQKGQGSSIPVGIPPSWGSGESRAAGGMIQKSPWC